MHSYIFLAMKHCEYGSLQLQQNRLGINVQFSGLLHYPLESTSPQLHLISFPL